MFPNLKYDYHDSILTYIHFIAEDSFEMNIELSPFIYPKKPQIKLKFFEIYNIKKFRKFIQKMMDFKDIANQHFLGYKINMLDYDNRNKTTENHVYIFLDVDWAKHITIHCKSIIFEKI